MTNNILVDSYLNIHKIKRKVFRKPQSNEMDLKSDETATYPCFVESKNVHMILILCIMRTLNIISTFPVKF